MSVLELKTRLGATTRSEPVPPQLVLAERVERFLQEHVSMARAAERASAKLKVLSDEVAVLRAKQGGGGGKLWAFTGTCFSCGVVGHRSSGFPQRAGCGKGGGGKGGPVGKGGPLDWFESAPAQQGWRSSWRPHRVRMCVWADLRLPEAPPSQPSQIADTGGNCRRA